MARRHFLSLLAGEALSVGLILADHRYHHLDALRSTLSVVVYPLHYLASLPDMLARKVEGRMAEEEELRAA